MQKHLQRCQITPSNQNLTEYKRALFTWAILLLASVANAQTVYRCGDQYSASPSCNQAITPYVEDPRNASQAQTQKSQTVQAQQEADALEKNRLKVEQQSMNNMALIPSASHRAQFSGKLDSHPTNSPSHGKHAKQSSSYFTAKDNTPKPPKEKIEKNSASPKAAP